MFKKGSDNDLILNDKPGFAIIDPGKKVLACMTQAKADKRTCDDTVLDQECVTFPDLSKAKYESQVVLTDKEPSAPISIFSYDQNKSLNSLQSDPLTLKEGSVETPIEHKTTATLNAERNAKEQKEKQEHYQTKLKALSECTIENKGDLDKFNELLAEIKNIEGYTEADVEPHTLKLKDITKELDEKEYQALLKMLADKGETNASDEAFSTTISAFEKFAQKHPAHTKELVDRLYTMAIDLTKAHEANPIAWDNAKKLVDGAERILKKADSKDSGLSAAEKSERKKKFDASHSELRIGKLAAILKEEGTFDPIFFQAEFKKAAKANQTALAQCSPQSNRLIITSFPGSSNDSKNNSKKAEACNKALSERQHLINIENYAAQKMQMSQMHGYEQNQQTHFGITQHHERWDAPHGNECNGC